MDMTELSPSQVAKEMSVSPSTVRRWEQTGVLAPVRRLPGSKYRRYSRADVDALKSATERSPDPSDRRGTHERRRVSPR